MTPLDLSQWLFLVWWTAMGLMVGSFLNVAIHRLPREGQSLSRPRRSRCPSCGQQLTWRENIPLVSWLLQRGCCKSCGWAIPWRYPLVELVTALLWLVLALRTGLENWDLLGVQTLVVSALIVASFVDFEHFEIPDEISIGGMLLAPVLVLLVPEVHADTWVARWVSEGPEVDRAGALLGCLTGMAAGAGSLLAVGWLGKLAFGRDAMGLGDVKLLGAGGALIGPGGVAVALTLAALLASVAGLGNILRFLLVIRARDRSRGRRRSLGRVIQSARVAGRYVPFGPYLAAGIGIALVYWDDVSSWLIRG